MGGSTKVTSQTSIRPHSQTSVRDCSATCILYICSKIRDSLVLHFPQGPSRPCRQPLTCISPKPSLGSRARGTNQCGPSTFPMEFPVAVHLPLGLSPVATVGPDGCLPHGHHSSTCSRVEKSSGEGEDESEGHDFVGCVV